MTRLVTVAHRAANSLDRLRAAAADGVDLIECDVHAHRGRLEVRHEKSMGPLPWLWDRWYVVPAAGPRLLLAEVAAAAAGLAGVQLLLDLKGWQPWLGRATAAAMEEAAPGLPYTVCSRHWHMLDAFADLPHVRTVTSVNSRRTVHMVRRRLRKQPAWGISVHRRLLAPPGRTVRLARLAPVLLTWPVNAEDELHEVVRLGVAGVISDELALLRLVRG